MRRLAPLRLIQPTNLTLIAIHLLELVVHGSNTFGTHKEGGGDSENIDENVR
jgi:hypothetical protein